MAKAGPRPARPARGIFDCDEAYRTPLPADYERVLTGGMVVLDANVLLNLYRSNERTRRDTLAVLGKLQDRLWIPHQVLSEFWQLRELPSVRHHHLTKAHEVGAALDTVRHSAEDALERWVSAVHLGNDAQVTRQIDDALESLAATLDGLRELIETQAGKDSLPGTAGTHTDPVLAELNALLIGRIGEPLPPEVRDAVEQEALKRAESEIPPGYEAFRDQPAERAAGDYVLWVQLMAEAKGRGCDVLLVTGEVKKDWWAIRDGGIPARPRPELVAEMRDRAGAGLYMLTQSELLSKAQELLGQEVDEVSVSALAQLGEGGKGADHLEEGWTEHSLRVFMDELGYRYPIQTRVIVAAAAGEGVVDRDTVYELAGYPEGRTLKGFTRPVGTVARELESQGELTGNEPFMLRTLYDDPSAERAPAAGFGIPGETIPLLRELYFGSPLWPAPVEP
ncbi:PIN-like domain-containing protein [Streptomyces sp. ACA25]|uniref:PIN-like domain-containing protein n=1 Tax=Streptomyces sp. ACA25 TaxID=3022596 RepID=UPI0023079911|nr:PIN-like domain-containing protein [Streptomyces sp. ACA25]MDB1087596.1 PIN-like domain-containing protein [Streptomyces sp. ACA25]